MATAFLGDLVSGQHLKGYTQVCRAGTCSDCSAQPLACVGSLFMPLDTSWCLNLY